jgi:ribonuclease HI
MTEEQRVTIYTDGGARGNPGPAAVGVVIMAGDEVAGEYKEYIGETTNNQAEYRAVLLALEQAREQGYTHLDFKLDSQLVVEQLNRRYKIKDKGLAKLFVEIWNQLPDFKQVTFTHIPREQNTEADRLVNEMLDDEESNGVDFAEESA